MPVSMNKSVTTVLNRLLTTVISGKVCSSGAAASCHCDNANFVTTFCTGALPGGLLPKDEKMLSTLRSLAGVVQWRAG